eukprot:COSAG04_NODE_6162_length_1394_cov_1.932819_1_plen_111_part_10
MSIYGEAEPGGESLAATLSEGSAKKGGGSLLGGFASWEAFKASRASQAAALLVGECTAKEVKAALERHGVEFEEEYRRLLEANAAGAFESSGGKKSRDYVGALGLLQRKAR